MQSARQSAAAFYGALIRSIFHVVWTLGLATAVCAAQPDSPDLSKLSLEELANITISTASRHSQNASDAPASVTVVTRADIQKYGYRTFADLLRSVRGFYVSYDRNYSYLGV